MVTIDRYHPKDRRELPMGAFEIGMLIFIGIEVAGWVASIIRPPDEMEAFRFEEQSSRCGV